MLIFVDEPGLALVGSDTNALEPLWRVLDAIRRAGAQTGVHCCALGAADAVFAAAPDFISFDAYHELEIYLSSSHMPAFLAGGGGLALGLIPTTIDPEKFSPQAALIRWMAATMGLDLNPHQLLQRSFITATCGLGLVDLDAARGSFAQAQRLARLLHYQEEYV